MKTKGSVTVWMVVFATIGCGDTGGTGDTGDTGKSVEVTSKLSNVNVKEERVYLKGDTVEILSYYDNFKIQTRGRVVNIDGSDLKIGCWDTFYPDGMKWSLNCFSNGVTDGKYQTWHPNGAVNILGHYSQGIKTGVWQFSDSTGVVVREFEATPR
jgi:antitoxin component YwqK of YwqJK toxin-antitoxin module